MSDKKKDLETPFLMPIGGSPETAEEMVNKYGTYEIQPTADSDHVFPAIAQGLPKDFDEPIDKPRIKQIREGDANDKEIL
ncbi:MAG: hypothetical protein IJP14_04070 [Clostridia bacterium]|nr:hypothetical protein [Clostridia bacterium]